MAAAKAEANTIVPEVLGYDNYYNWSACIKNYLLGQDLWDIVESPPMTADDFPNTEEYKVWRRKNAAALHAILFSCGPLLLDDVSYMSSANAAWNKLAEIDQIPNVTDDDVVDQDNNNTNQQSPETDHTAEWIKTLVQAINTGDLEEVNNIIEREPDSRTAIVDATMGYTPLHLAIKMGQVTIAEQLIQQLSPQELELQDAKGSTALNYAATNANIRIAECIINAVNNNNNNNNNTNIFGIASNDGNIPVVSASITGHKNLTRYLYSLTPPELLNGTSGSSLICSTIMNELFDVALDLIRRYPNLAAVQSQSGMVPLEALSRMPSVFPSGSRLSFWRQFVSRCLHTQLPAASSTQFCINIQQDEENYQGNISELKQGISKLLKVIRQTLLEISGIEELYEMKLNQLYAIEILNCTCREIPQNIQSFVTSAFFRAIKNGTVELVAKLCKANPKLLDLENVKNDDRTIFSLAIQYRQENIFNLIYGLKTRKDAMTICKDSSKNNMLHVAGLMAPPNQLAHISGAALKMQRQLQWYKEVERVVNPSYKLHRNSDSDQPHELFSKEHNELKKQGEAWMKENATSCSIVAALIITVMFTAVFTIPGGNDQNTGYPMFLRKTQLKVFVIADVISLFSSTTSVLMFQGILTSRYAEEDFLKSLPRKLMIGLSTLFISIAAMMVAFCAALIIMFKGQKIIVVPSVVLALFPIAAFLLLQSPLLIEIFMSTYGPSIFNRKMKPWL